jgi:hypothetical protein
MLGVWKAIRAGWYCLMVRELWNFIFVVFGVKWVMPKAARGVLKC